MEKEERTEGRKVERSSLYRWNIQINNGKNVLCDAFSMNIDISTCKSETLVVSIGNVLHNISWVGGLLLTQCIQRIDFFSV